MLLHQQTFLLILISFWMTSQIVGQKNDTPSFLFQKDERYFIQNNYSSMHIISSSTNPIGTNIRQQKVNIKQEAEWQFIKEGDFYKIKNICNEYFLRLKHDPASVDVIFWNDENDLLSLWKLERISDEEYKIKSVSKQGLVLCLRNGNRMPLTDLKVYPDQGQKDAIWRIFPDSKKD